MCKSLQKNGFLQTFADFKRAAAARHVLYMECLQHLVEDIRSVIVEKPEWKCLIIKFCLWCAPTAYFQSEGILGLLHVLCFLSENGLEQFMVYWETEGRAEQLLQELCPFARSSSAEMSRPVSVRKKLKQALPWRVPSIDRWIRKNHMRWLKAFRISQSPCQHIPQPTLRLGKRQKQLWNQEKFI